MKKITTSLALLFFCLPAFSFYITIKTGEDSHWDAIFDEYCWFNRVLSISKNKEASLECNEDVFEIAFSESFRNESLNTVAPPKKIKKRDVINLRYWFSHKENTERKIDNIVYSFEIIDIREDFILLKTKEFLQIIPY